MVVADFGASADQHQLCKTWASNFQIADPQLFEEAASGLTYVAQMIFFAFLITRGASYIRRRFLQNRVFMARVLLLCVSIAVEICVGLLQGSMMLERNLGGPLPYYAVVAMLRFASFYWQVRLFLEQREDEMTGAAPPPEETANDNNELIEMKRSVIDEPNSLNAAADTLPPGGSVMDQAALQEEALLNTDTGFGADWRRMKGRWSTDTNDQSPLAKIVLSTVVRLMARTMLYIITGSSILLAAFFGIDIFSLSNLLLFAATCGIAFYILVSRGVTLQFIAEFKEIRAKDVTVHSVSALKEQLEAEIERRASAEGKE
jgi:hypothetical protein